MDMNVVETSRVVCDILRDMRNCCKTANYSYLPGLIEELQYHANIVEAKHEAELEEEWKKQRELRKEVKELKGSSEG